MGKHEMRKLITKVEEKLSGITLATTAPSLSVKQKDSITTFQNRHRAAKGPRLVWHSWDTGGVC